ncbi:MAG TPA: o-succinylbenzoate synthase [Xenococcaceae cyanobacterium]|jgi:O-succinylbenzoate synthase
MVNELYQFKFELYQRNFRQPLHTSHGIWRVRKGIIITISDRGGKIAQGEIAPIPWFGSETLLEAQEFCLALGKMITVEEIISIPDRLPCCQFAFESALTQLQPEAQGIETPLKYCYLLPAGTQVLQQNLSLIATTTFKWKIAVYPLSEEIPILQQLITQLPSDSKLRLDANGGLNLSQAEKWLKVADETQVIEFIEQPLPPAQFSTMLALSTTYRTPIALDESVATIKQLETCYQAGWQGIFIIKAAIAGFPSRLRHFCLTNSLDSVFSSVFETNIGRQAVLKLASELSNRDRAIGFGIDNYL